MSGFPELSLATPCKCSDTLVLDGGVGMLNNTLPHLKPKYRSDCRRYCFRSLYGVIVWTTGRYCFFDFIQLFPGLVLDIDRYG